MDKRIRVLQYRPAFFEGFESEEHILDTPEEILQLDFVKKFKEDENFYRFSVVLNRACPARIAPETWPIANLMAEYDDGRKWWVVAQIWTEDREELLRFFPKWSSE